MGHNLHCVASDQHNKSMTVWACAFFAVTFPSCVLKVARKKKVSGSQTILARGFGTRGKIDLTYLSSVLDGEFKNFLVHGYHGIKISELMTLTSKIQWE